MKNALIPCLTALSLLGANAVQAQSVELTSVDGSSRVTGKLVSVRDGKYTLNTTVGLAQFNVNEYYCLGSACPVDVDGEIGTTVSGPSELAEVIFPLLAEGFAEENELEAETLSADGFLVEDDAAFNPGSDKNQFIVQFYDEDHARLSSFTVQNADGAAAFDMMLNGQTDIIISEGTVTPSYQNAVLDAGLGNLGSFEQERVIAVDGFAAIVHPSNSINSLTVEQISQILSGEISSWSALGGPAKKINVYAMPESAGLSHNIAAILLEPEGRRLVDNASEVSSSRALSRAVQSDPFGFGIIRFSNLRDAKAVAIENECGMIIDADLFGMKSEEYALQNRVVLYNTAEPGAVGEALLSYLDSSSVDDLVSKSGLVSLSVNEQGPEMREVALRDALQSVDPAVSVDLLQTYVLEMMDTHRLSTTFRFSPGSAGLDNKARRDLARINSYIQTNQPNRIILAGFADANGSFSSNRDLSAQRALGVLQELRQLAGPNGFGKTDVQIEGFGELGPVACNQTLRGRAINRRVEVWVDH